MSNVRDISASLAMVFEQLEKLGVKRASGYEYCPRSVPLTARERKQIRRTLRRHLRASLKLLDSERSSR